MTEDTNPDLVDDRREAYGRYFEDLPLGLVIRHWPGRTVTQMDDILFSQLTMNQHPLHSDDHYAAETEYGQCAVNGTFILALVHGMTVADLSGRGMHLGYREVTMLAPTFHGDSLYARSRVTESRLSKSRPGWGVVWAETHGFTQRDDDVIRFERGMMVPCRGTE